MPGISASSLALVSVRSYMTLTSSYRIVGNLLLAQLREAVYMHSKHGRLHRSFTEALPMQLVQEWRQMVEAWLADEDAPDPFEEEDNGEFGYRTVLQTLTNRCN